MNVKKNLGKKLSGMGKKGDPNKCFSVKSQKDINSYCECNYKDQLLQKECKDKSQFCYLCCDNEIGKINQANLDCCYNRCDKIKSDGKCSGFDNKYHIVAINPHHHHLLRHGAHHHLLHHGGLVGHHHHLVHPHGGHLHHHDLIHANVNLFP